MSPPKLAMSNISWPPEARARAYELLEHAGFSGVEISPGLLFHSEDNPRKPSSAALDLAMAEVQRYRLSFVAMQSLHFGLTKARLFGNEAGRSAFTAAVAACCDLAKNLGVGVLTIGSAPNRQRPPELGEPAALSRARETLLPLADRAAKAGLKLAIEPIPAAYGANFLTTLAETLSFVSSCDHPGLRLNFDTGAMTMSGEIEKLDEHYAAARPWIAHIHVGAPNLQPVARDDAWLSQLVQLSTREEISQVWMSAEMRPDQADGLAAARKAANALGYHALGRS